MITDPTLAPTMTKSWEAFQSFKAGLKHWKEFEAQQDDKDLEAVRLRCSGRQQRRTPGLRLPITGLASRCKGRDSRSEQQKPSKPV